MPSPYLPDYFPRCSDKDLVRLAEHLGIKTEGLSREQIEELVEWQLFADRNQGCGGYNG